VSALEVGLDADGCRLSGTVHEPSVPLRGSVVLAHPSGDGSRDQPLFRHLATTLPAIGVAVLAYDRRASEADVPVERQAADLRIAIDGLHERYGPHRSGIWVPARARGRRWRRQSTGGSTSSCSSAAAR